MSKLLSPGRSRVAIQICVASAAAALLSGCSSDAMRFNDPFSNPFATGSIEKPKHVAATKPIGTGRVPPVTAQALPPKPIATASVAPIQPTRPIVSAETTGSIGPARVVPGASFGGWTASGGVPVVVAQGETASILAQRYGVPENALLGANGLHAAADMQPGLRITIPIYNASGAAPRAVVAAAPVPIRSEAPARVAVAAPERVVVRAPAKIAVVAPPRVVAKVEGRPARVEPRPVARQAAVVVKTAPAKAAVVAVAPGRVMRGAAPVKQAMLETPPKAIVTAPAKPIPAKPAEAPRAAIDPAPTASVAPAAAAPAADAGPEFRWPARGRIIDSFKAGAGGNDGINIAVPEGTPVKAAENGVVAYAGSELKGYGNMILIRHPNGFVTAYANNGEIDVKKGDVVKRGQLIAKSGQTGNVTSPQLHFELRKGATPVDPTSYLAGL